MFTLFAHFTALIFFLVSLAASAMPSRVVLIRHAEKPTGEEGVHLSSKGYKRAAALPKFFQQHYLGTSMKLYAQGLKHEDSSQRPIETLKPTASTFGLKINTQFVKDEASRLVEHISSHKALNHSMVVVSWGHDELGKIARKLGYDNRADGEKQEWPGGVFDRAWILDFNSHGKLVKFEDVPQCLLPGDSRD